MRTLEQGGTDEISIRVGTVCVVKGIAQRVREEILLGCVNGIPSAAAVAASGGGQWCNEEIPGQGLPSPPASNCGQCVGHDDLLVPFIE